MKTIPVSCSTVHRAGNYIWGLATLTRWLLGDVVQEGFLGGLRASEEGRIEVFLAIVHAPREMPGAAMLTERE
jgi:hypothetical protein